MNTSVSGVGPTQQPAQVVAPATPEQRPVPQADAVQRPSAPDMTQQAVQLFNGIFQLPSDLNYANGVTYEQVQGKVSKELFDLIANGMKTSDEVQGSDNTITADEIEGFISNVALFMQMAQLDPNDPTELARVARLYNKDGGSYTRVSVGDYQQISATIDQLWTEKTATDPYQKAAEVLGGDAAQMRGVLDGISGKINKKNYGEADEAGQKKTLIAFALTSKAGIDINTLYGLYGDRPQTDAAQGPGTPATQAEQIQGIGVKSADDPLLFTVYGQQIGRNQFDAYVQRLVSADVEMGNGKKMSQLSSEEQRKTALFTVMSQIGMQKEMQKMTANITDDDIVKFLAGSGGGITEDQARETISKMTTEQKDQAKQILVFKNMAEAIPEQRMTAIDGYSSASDEQKLSMKLQLAAREMEVRVLNEASANTSFADPSDPLKAQLEQVAGADGAAEAGKKIDQFNAALRSGQTKKAQDILNEMKAYLPEEKVKEAQALIDARRAAVKTNEKDTPDRVDQAKKPQGPVVSNGSYADGKCSMQVEGSIAKEKLKVTSSDGKTEYKGTWANQEGRWIFTSEEVLPAGMKHVYYNDTLIFPFNVQNGEEANEGSVKIDLPAGANQIIVTGASESSITIVDSESANVSVSMDTEESGTKVTIDISKLNPGKYTIKAGSVTKEFTVAANTEGESEISEGEGE